MISTVYRRMDAALQDQTTPLRVLKFFNPTGELTLASTVVVGARAMTVTNATGVEAGHILCFKQAGRQFQGIVLSIAGAPTLTIDTPFDYAFTAAAVINYGSSAMNVDGSSNPVTFRIGAAAGSRLDVTQVRIGITDNADMDDSKFGGMTALTNGLVLQYTRSGITYSVGNVKTNGQLRLTCSGEYATKAPAGSYGFSAVCHLGGQENAGVVIRLDGNTGDQIQLIVQDNLTGLTSATALVIGHVVED